MRQAKSNLQDHIWKKNSKKILQYKIGIGTITVW